MYCRLLENCVCIYFHSNEQGVSLATYQIFSFLLVKCSSWTDITWEVVRNADSQTPPRPTESNPHFRRSRYSVCIFKFEKHCWMSKSIALWNRRLFFPHEVRRITCEEYYSFTLWQKWNVCFSQQEGSIRLTGPIPCFNLSNFSSLWQRGYYYSSHWWYMEEPGSAWKCCPVKGKYGNTGLAIPTSRSLSLLSLV